MGTVSESHYRAQKDGGRLPEAQPLSLGFTNDSDSTIHRERMSTIVQMTSHCLHNVCHLCQCRNGGKITQSVMVSLTAKRLSTDIPCVTSLMHCLQSSDSKLLNKFYESCWAAHNNALSFSLPFIFSLSTESILIIFSLCGTHYRGSVTVRSWLSFNPSQSIISLEFPVDRSKERYERDQINTAYCVNVLGKWEVCS